MRCVASTYLRTRATMSCPLDVGYILADISDDESPAENAATATYNSDFQRFCRKSVEFVTLPLR